MTPPKSPIPRYSLAPDLDISRIVTGLWQVADLERGGQKLDAEGAARELADYAAAGFDSFDMADHYGSAEEIIGALAGRGAGAGGPAFRAFTKWCPEPGGMTSDIARAAVERARSRMNTDCIDLMQFHWWMYEHPGYLDALRALFRLRDEGLIRHVGLTNFNTDPLAVLVHSGLAVVTNQVCFSLLDRRAGGAMSAFCLAHGVRLLAYGTLAGGLLSERWLDAPEPAGFDDWSKMKYGRFIAAIGGWPALQAVLAAADAIARKHAVSIANVATRWVLDQPAVAAVIVGARITESEHRADNARVFAFELDDEDRVRLDDAFIRTTPVPGDCGDEYRKPPFLTASGDLSHHLENFPKVYRAVAASDRPDHLIIDSGSIWEPICGYARAMRRGERILVSGTTATHGSGETVAPGDAAAQAVYILDKITAAITSLGGRLEDVVRTRIYLADADDWEAVSRVHGRYFGTIRPANTLIEVSRLIGDYRVEIEAEAVVD